MSGFNLDAGFFRIAWPRMVQGFGLGLFFVPLTTATFMNIPKEDTGNASAIFNLLRNLGGSFGVAISTTVLAQRAQVHQTFLVERVTPYDPAFQIKSQRILQWLKMYNIEEANSTTVLNWLYQEVLRQANMLAFNDTFWLLSCFTAALIPLTLLFRKRSDPSPPGAV
jgi:DHA2 family multidrug resistance protein